MSPEGSHHLPTHLRNSRLCLATANHQGYEDPCDACINAGWCLPSSLAGFHCVGTARSAHTVPTQCARSARVVHQLGQRLRARCANCGPLCLIVEYASLESGVNFVVALGTLLINHATNLQ